MSYIYLPAAKNGSIRIVTLRLGNYRKRLTRDLSAFYFNILLVRCTNIPITYIY